MPKPRATWSIAFKPVPAIRSLLPCGMKSASEYVCASAGAETKCITMPPGTRIAGMRISPGPIALSKRAECSAVARLTARTASLLPMPMAQTDGPCVEKRACANESGCEFRIKLISPCLYSTTSLVRCLPAHRKPSCSSKAPSAFADAASTANSRNEMPESDGADGGLKSSVRSSACLAFPSLSCALARRDRRSRTSLSRNSSERIASVAVRRVGAARKTSLNISSDSGPAYPASKTCSRKFSTSNWPCPGKQR